MIGSELPPARWSRLLLVLLSWVASSGCHGTAGDVPTYWEDVRPILEGRCQNCHYQGGIGGFDLGNYEAAADWAPAIAASVAAGSMPPWPAAPGPNYEYNWSLDPQQIAILTTWAEFGAPEGDPELSVPGLPSIGSSLSRVDVRLSLPEPYTPNSNQSDDYRCFPLDWTGAEPSYITGFNAVPGNTELVHHIAAFLVSADNLLGDSVFDQLAQWDADEEGPGYSCFGGPSGPSGDLQLPIQQIAQWVPGNQGLDFPAGSGIEILPGSTIVLQVHYNNNPQAASVEDQSSIELKLDDSVEVEGAFAPWLDMSWALGSMEIPPLVSDWEVSVQADPRSFFELLNPALQLDAGFTIHSAMLHMHRLGGAGSLSVIHPDGSKTAIVHIPQWDFDWQLNYQLSSPVSFAEGDELSLTCSYDNGEEGALRTNWGEGTDDEMCVGNLYITPL